MIKIRTILLQIVTVRRQDIICAMKKNRLRDWMLLKISAKRSGGIPVPMTPNLIFTSAFM